MLYADTPPEVTAQEELGVETVTVDLPPDNRRGLESVAARATVWTIVAYGVTQALRMCNNIVLTHLLLPQYFGLMALASTLVMGMTLLSDIGLLPSVVNSPRGDEPLFLNTAWTIQIIRGLVLWVVCCALAYPLSKLYHDKRILSILPVLAIQMVLNGFSSINLMRTARHIGVRRLLVIDLGSQLFAMCVTIGTALRYPSVWALVAGTLAGAMAKTALSHVPAVLPGHRNRFAWDRTCVTSLVHFGKWVILGTGFYFFASQADRLILGRLVPFAVLGVYNIAFTIADIPRQVILQFSNRVGFPFVSKLTHLPLPQFRERVLKYRRMVLAAGALVLSIVVVWGGPVATHLYDKRYADARWIVPVLALGLWHTLLYNTTGNILLALGKPKYNAVGTASFCFTMFVSLPVAFHFYGLFGAVVAVAAGDVPLYITLAIGSAREKVSVWAQDALATAGFACLLGIEFLIRHFV